MSALPTNLIESVRRDESGERRAWVARLAGVVGQLAEHWSLRVGDPYEPGGQCSWVAPVQDAAGRERVLKVGWRHEESEHEADGLRAWAGDGAVGLHDALVCGDTSALLLECCRPGTTLGSTAGEPEQDVVIAGLLKRLWIAPPDGVPLRSLQVMCDAWATEFEQRLAMSPRVIDSGLARAGMEAMRGLPGSATGAVVLATDLHAGNVLAAQREPWLVIDPKPYVGDSAYDPVQHMLNCEERLVADPAGLARRMADLLDLDRSRVAAWLFARCVQECIDEPSLRAVAATLASA